MANIKISELDAATSVASGDLFEVSQGSGTLTSRKATGTQVQSFVLGSYAGASSITTLGTVTSGTWNATAVALGYGGTGATDAAGARTNLGLVIGTNVQAYSANLTGFAAKTAPTGDVVGTTDAQSLSGKTLTNPTVTNYVETVYAPSAGTAFTVDLANGTIQKFTTSGNLAITLPSSVAGKSYMIIVAYGGAHTLSFSGGSTIKWAGGSAPTATSANGKIDIYSFWCDGTNTYGIQAGANF